MSRIELGDRFEKFVDAQVEAGRYGSAREVVEAALALLEADQAEREAAVAELRTKIQASLDDPRPSIPAEEVFALLDAKHVRRLARG